MTDDPNRFRAVCKTLLLLTWALWFGGVMGLFLSVQILFHQTDRPIFLAAAPKLFLAFERYQLVLAVASIVFCIIARSRRMRALIALLSIGTIGAIIETTLITPRIEALRIAGATHTPEFLKLHGLSMCVYMLVAIALLVVGVVQSFI